MKKVYQYVDFRLTDEGKIRIRNRYCFHDLGAYNLKYELLRDGCDVVGLKRPPWWRFGTAGRTLTVCARRKNWRNRGTPIVGAAMPVSSAMLSPRERSKRG